MCQHMRQHQPSASCASSPLHSASDVSIRVSQNAAALQEPVRKSCPRHLLSLLHHRYLKFTDLHGARAFNHLQRRRWLHGAPTSEHLPSSCHPAQMTANTMATMLLRRDRKCSAHLRAILLPARQRMGKSYTAGREAYQPTTS